MNAATEYAGKNILQCTRMIVQKEGVMGLWRGNFTNCVRVFPHAATQFTAYDYFKTVIPLMFSDPTSYIAKVVCGGLAGTTRCLR
jgi:solute carrier family 25 protein 16